MVHGCNGAPYSNNRHQDEKMQTHESGKHQNVKGGDGSGEHIVDCQLLTNCHGLQIM